MLFTLIKNELIKLLRKAKTWIVFGLFALFIGVTIYAQYSGDQRTREYQSPEMQLQFAKDNLSYYKEELESSKENETSPEYIEYIKQSIEDSEAQIKSYENIIKNGLDEEAWKLELDAEISSLNQTIKDYEEYDDVWSKQYLEESKERLDMLNYLKDNNIEPIYGWEYESYNYMTVLMEILGMAILLCGIAVFMSDIVSGECTPATLKFLLVQPVTRGKVLLSKFISVTLVVLAMIMGGELLGFTFVNLTSKISGSSYPVTIGTLYNKVINSEGISELVKIAGSGHMGTNLELFIKAMLFQGLFIITACSVVFLISTLIKSSMITMAISVVVTVFLTISCQLISSLRNIAHLIFVNYGNTISVFTGNGALSFNNADLTVRNGIIVMIVTIIISYTIAHFNFKNKDILI